MKFSDDDIAAGETRIIGPPGTGKTTFLAKGLAYWADQYGPDNVVAMSFTRAAAAELAGRKTKLPRQNIGTVHSFAWRALDGPEIAETPDRLAEFSRETNYSLQAARDVDDAYEMGHFQKSDDWIFSELSRVRNARIPCDHWPKREKLRRFERVWNDYKKQTDTMDFTDLLEVALNERVRLLDEPATLLVDEAQDSTALQLDLIRHWGAKTDRFALALDPDQSIYGFAGADPRVFLRQRPKKQFPLTQSHRVPRAVAELAKRWISKIDEREPVDWQPRDADGEVRRHWASWQNTDGLVSTLLRALDDDGTVMVEASCAYMIAPLVKLLRKEGIPFANPWRSKRGDWNPLAKKKANVSTTVAAIAAFLEPWQQKDGVRVWTVEQARAWVPLTKKLFKHGEASCIVNLPENATPREVCQTFLDHLITRDDWEQMTAGPPANVRWLLTHLRAGKARQAVYAAAVAMKYGLNALEEKPRLYVGTIHSFKGAEADHVFLFPDLSPQGALEWWKRDPKHRATGRAAVIRQFYVGMTRAKESLTICAASSDAHVALR